MRAHIRQHARPAAAPASPYMPAAPTMVPLAAHHIPVHDIGRVPIAGVSGRDTVQRQAAPSDAASTYSAPNRTGLPGDLRSGIEAMSGMSMDGVRVHYGSSEPAELNAHAFTRGSDIHLAPGQDRHLPHEAWHVVQQAQGRVRPTIDVGGAQVNDDQGLEREADMLGERSRAYGQRAIADRPADRIGQSEPGAAAVQLQAVPDRAGACVQRVIKIGTGTLAGTYKTKGGKDTKGLITKVDTEIGDDLARGWKGYVADLAGEKKTYSYTSTATFQSHLEDEFEKEAKLGKVRPNFPKIAYELGAISRELQTGVDQSDLKPSEEDLALPHRFPFATIKSSTQAFIEGEEDEDELDRWSDRLIEATEERRDLNVPEITNKKKRQRYEGAIEKQIENVKAARTRLEDEIDAGEDLDLHSSSVQDFMKHANALHGNIPDYGPHSDVNIPVSDRLHLHFNDDGTLTPGSHAAVSMTPTRVPKGIAYTKSNKFLVTTDGKKVRVSTLQQIIAKMISRHAVGTTTIQDADLEEQEFD